MKKIKVRVKGAKKPSLLFYFEGVLDAKNSDDISLKQRQFESIFSNFASKECATLVNKLNADYTQRYQLESEVEALEKAQENITDVASSWRISSSIAQKSNAIHSINGKILANEHKARQICDHAKKIVTYKYRAYAKGYGRVKKNIAFENLTFEDINFEK